MDLRTEEKKEERKLKKIMTTILTLCMLLSPVTGGVSALSTPNNSKLEVELIDFVIKTDYYVKDTKVRYKVESNSYIAEIIDRDTNEIIGWYSEATEDMTVAQAFFSRNTNYVSDTFQRTLKGTINLFRNDPAIAAQGEARVEVTAGQSWAQINRMISQTHRPARSGSYDFTSKSTYDNTSGYPTQSVTIEMNGSCDVTKSQASTSGFSFGLLEGLGFNFSNTETSNWTARQLYGKTVTIAIR